MQKFSLVLGLFLLTSTSAMAAVVPRCGEIERRDLKPVYEAADVVRNVYDVREAIKEACDTMQAFEKWERKNKAEISAHSGYENSKQSVVSDVNNALMSLRSPLIILRGIASQDAKDENEKYVRAGKIEELKLDLNEKVKSLNTASQNVIDFTTRKYKPEEQKIKPEDGKEMKDAVPADENAPVVEDEKDGKKSTESEKKK